MTILRALCSGAFPRAERDMAKIFLSWGKPDEAEVRPVVARLRSLGLDLFEYSEDMPAGAEIDDQVVDEIDAATVAVICFSDETAHRGWIERESTLVHQALRDGTKPMRRLLPVWVGRHPDNHRPAVVANKSYATLDLFGGGDGALDRLVRDVHDALDEQAPIGVPATLIAMNHEEAQRLFAEGTALGPARDLCCAFGMKVDDLDVWLDRYAEAARDFAPFDTDEPLCETLETAVGATNLARVKSGARPLFLRWVDRELASADADERREARDLFRSHPSLLVVDSLSVFSEPVRDRLAHLPHPDDKRTSAVLWVPPFTGHTASIDGLLSAAAGANDLLSDVFREWTSEQRPAVFDSLTPTTLRIAIERILISVPSELPPNSRSRAAGRCGATTQTQLTALLDPR